MSALTADPRFQALQARFHANVAVGDMDDCWLWTGNVARNGYGRMKVHNKAVSAHRLSFALFNGWISKRTPDGKRAVIRHTCDNPVCVNPTHLLFGSDKDNHHDAVTRGRRDDAAIGRYASTLRWAGGPKFGMEEFLALPAGMSAREQAIALGCSTATVARLRREAKAA